MADQFTTHRVNIKPSAAVAEKLYAESMELGDDEVPQFLVDHLTASAALMTGLGFSGLGLIEIVRSTHVKVLHAMRVTSLDDEAEED